MSAVPVRNTVDTVNAAATAIVAADTRLQPPPVQKRRWSSCWSVYWCFGSYKQSKRIGHAVLVSEPAPTGTVLPIAENRNHSSTVVLPFIAPPSSPASFLPSDPPSATQSPNGLLSLSSLSVNVQSPGRTAPIYTIGPYAHETQLVSPPVFSTFTTEPSTASFTPPPEPVHMMTTPSSPEVPFAELLSSSLAQNKTNLKYLSQYEFKPYQYPGSPGSHVKSPGSAISSSGTSSPFPDKRPGMAGAPKYIRYENYRWDSRVGSGSLTPSGWGSRLGSGTLTPTGGISRLASGTLTPTGAEPFEAESLADHKLENGNNALIAHRVSFELFGEDIPTCTVTAPPIPQCKTASRDSKDGDFQTKNSGSFREHFKEESSSKVSTVDKNAEGDGSECPQKNRTVSLGSNKDFNFNNTKGEEVGEKCEWWTNDQNVVNEKEVSPRSSWSFFPMLQSKGG